MMKAMVKGIKSNGEEFGYIVEDIINVVYTNEIITLVKVMVHQQATQTQFQTVIDTQYQLCK